MPYPVTTSPAGMPNYSGTYIPEIWSGKLLVKFYDVCTLAAVSNVDYEGEIKNQGDKVIIRTVPDITIHNHEKNAVLNVDFPTSPTVELEIDRGKYFSFKCDDVDKIQMDISAMDTWSEDAAQQMKIEIETDVYSTLAADAHATNAGAAAGRVSGDINLGETGSPIAITKDNILDKIVDLGVVLDENNIPETQRFLLLPAAYCGLIKKSELRDASITGDGTSVMRNGRLGVIDRFTLYSTNLLPTIPADGGCVNLLAGHPAALTFATQLTENESLRSESTFGDIVRGLQVYGFKVIKPEALAAMYATKG